MPIYRAPIDDFRFVLNELLEIDKHRDLPGFADLTPDLVDDILTNAGKFCEQVLQPINQSDVTRAVLASLRCLAADGFEVGAVASTRTAPGLWSRRPRARHLAPDPRDSEQPVMAVGQVRSLVRQYGIDFVRIQCLQRGGGQDHRRVRPRHAIGSWLRMIDQDGRSEPRPKKL